MLITEYRIPFPATVNEYRVGMLYMIARASAEEARRAGGNGAVEVLRNERYVANEHGLEAGIYTEKVYHIEKFLPRFLRMLVPSSKAKVIEKSWASYPQRCLTLYYSPYFGSNSFLSIESRYAENDQGEQWNALGLKPDELNSRHVVTLDIASEENMRMTPDADVRAFYTSKGGGRGHLEAGTWFRSSSPVMCCYKVCRLDIGHKPRVEQWGQRFVQGSFIRYNRQALVWMDSWLGLALGDIPGAEPGPGPSSSSESDRYMHAAAVKQNTRTLVATELATDAVGLAAAVAFARADETDPFC